MLSFSERKQNSYARLLAKLTPDTECFGVFGRPPYDRSFYRVHFKHAGRWHSVEHTDGVGANPFVLAERLGSKAAASWHGPLKLLGSFDCHPGRAALVQLLERARALCS